MRKLALFLLALPTLASAAALNSVDYTRLNGTTVSFNELGPDGLLEGLISSGGVQFGERFAGQELSVTKAPRPGEIAQDWFDDLSFGLPSNGLLLQAGANGANLGVYDYGDARAQALAGIGPQNPDGSDPFGFGAISARFASGQQAIGFQLRDANGGGALLSLYRLDGSLIQTVSLGPVSDRSYAFERSGGEADIAGFSLTNVDSYYGVAVDNLVYGSVSAVPEPSSSWLLAAGLLALGAAAKRRFFSSFSNARQA
ncbi:MAG: PEP-CTERM sorting domain-containing protein [Paucibacter sp.]|nr:PEP-CTERM sorting domain-containing protein [Roseateles sp.]